MDPELKKGFQELQAQVIESRSKIANIETRQKVTTHDAKINDSILEEFTKDADLDKKFFYQPIGRMLVKQEGNKAHEILLDRQKVYQERLKQYQEIKEICLNRVKESENSLRELVNKKLNKTEQQQPSSAVNSKQQENNKKPSSDESSSVKSTQSPSTKDKGDEAKKI